MPATQYHKRIVEYYSDSENAYIDSWDLNNSLAIHYGYWDERVKTFPQSLQRMNEIMSEAADIKENYSVLDAGCGIGGSSIFIAQQKKCKVTGITLSERQVIKAKEIAEKRKLTDYVEFHQMNYSATSFPDQSFDIVWGCESICYADDKKQFIQEAFRLLKPGGRLIIADGFVTKFENNEHPIVRKWLDGWQVNYLESPEQFCQFMSDIGFINVNYKNISRHVQHSSRRLFRVYYLAKFYVLWKKLSFSGRATPMQKGNINACKYQFYGLKNGLWQYGLVTGIKE